MTKTKPDRKIDLICMLRDVGPDADYYHLHAVAYVKIGDARVYVKTPPAVISRLLDPNMPTTWRLIDTLIMILEAIGFDREEAIDPQIKPPLRREA